MTAAIVSALVFLAIVPFAQVQLREFRAFIPAYQATLVATDLLTAILLYRQFGRLRLYALLLLANGYLFAALMAIVHALTFPELFAPQGLLGAGPQTTAWLYMFWHGGFPVMIVAYSLINDSGRGYGRSARVAVLPNVTAVVVAVAVLTLVATAGSNLLPPIMAGNGYTPLMIAVVTAVWACSFGAFLVLWLRMPYSILDIWLMLTMLSWMFDIALSAVFNAGRFDVGFYAGRIYGLAAAAFVFVALVVDASRARSA